MLVTINTDASLVEGHGGYAFWIVCNDGKIQKAGKIKGRVTTSQNAELFCIANALYTLSKSRFKKISKIIINTDSSTCIDILSGLSKIPSKSSLSRKAYEECLFSLLEILVNSGRSVRDLYSFFELRHVKAHTNNVNARSMVNKWCDSQAKKYARQSFKENKNNNG